MGNSPHRSFAADGSGSSPIDDSANVHDPSSGTAPDPTQVIDVAMSMFAADGYEATKLDAIAKESGMSKRMIHYHFSDKKGLYRQALNRALDRISPPPEQMNRSYAVPVEGMRRFVDALFYRFQGNSVAVSLVLRENLDKVLDCSEISSLDSHTDVLLYTERLLLLGQDSGAFRPGISAADVLALVSSICMFRFSNRHASLALGEFDLTNQRNTEGLRRMAIDMVLGFLTSNLPDSGYSSYLESTAERQPSTTAPVESYDIEEPELY